MPENSDSLRTGLFAEQRQAPPCVFVLFGATGDLAARKIAPALYNLHRDGLLDERSAVVGVARKPKSHEQFRSEMLEALRKHSRTAPEEADWTAVSRRWFYGAVATHTREEYAGLAALLRDVAAQVGGGQAGAGAGGSGGGEQSGGGAREAGLLYYLATAPDIWPQIVEGLATAGLARPPWGSGFVRVVAEKPFGQDLASARRLTQVFRKHWEERQVFRIDHYLGKETVQNILVLRFANAVFEPLLDRRHVDHIQITVAETVGMEGRRGPYYEEAGALRDMVQNHLLQVTALLTMERPAALATEEIRDRKAALLSCIRQPGPEEVAACTVRGQYLGDVKGPAYLQEAGVAPHSRTETFAAVRLAIENDRWSGVPIYLRTGKRLASKAGTVMVQFKQPAAHLFREAHCDLGGPNRLVIQLHPKEGAFLKVDAKVPGDRTMLRPVHMEFDYRSSFSSASPEAYERLLLDALCGEATLFIRDDEVEASWRFVDAIRAGWKKQGGELLPYVPGTWGPEKAEGLFLNQYQRWYNLEAR